MPAGAGRRKAEVEGEPPDERGLIAETGTAETVEPRREYRRCWKHLHGLAPGEAGNPQIMATRKDLPGTLKRSPKKAQDTYVAAHDSAVKEYGEGERAHRTALAAVKHSFEKVGDHWEKKAKKGPSDSGKKTAGGVDANASKDHLLKVAKKLDISGRSAMKKGELVKAIQKANAKSTRKAAAK